jgi:BioD-like phosphotransacetylase family protein
MLGLLLVSAQPSSGKTTVALGLARRLAAQNYSVSLSRLGDDSRAAADSDFFASLGRPGTAGEGYHLTEAPAGDIAAALSANPGIRSVIVATPAESPQEITSLVRSAGPVAGVVLNRVPSRLVEPLRRAYADASVHPLAMIPEDRSLASPTIGQVTEALNGDGSYIRDNADRVLDRVVIASIAADPGQSYFSRTGAEAVVVRSDKPDLQLAALNAEASCLIVTGGPAILSYVRERVDEEEIPLLTTALDTKETMEAIEGLFGMAPFRGDEKIRRAEELLWDLDLDALFERAAV